MNGLLSQYLLQRASTVILAFNPQATPDNGAPGNGLLNYETTSQVVGTLGISQAVVQFGSGTASIGTLSDGTVNIWPANFYGNQYVSTTQIADIAGKVALPLALISVGVDTIGLINNDITPTKFSVNTGFTGLGFYAPPYGAIAAGEYFIIDTVYPGGWPGFIKNAQPAAASFISSDIIMP